MMAMVAVTAALIGFSINANRLGTATLQALYSR